MASRCAYASLVQRDATGPAEHSVIIGCVWLRCLLPFGCMSIFLSYSGSALCSSTTCAARMAALGRLHCFRFFISVASPRKHIPSRPSGGPVCSSSAVCVCWATSTCMVPPSLVMSIMQITNKEMGSTFPRPHPRARHGEVCSRKGAEINNFPNSEFAIVVRRGLLFPRSGR